MKFDFCDVYGGCYFLKNDKVLFISIFHGEDYISYLANPSARGGYDTRSIFLSGV